MTSIKYNDDNYFDTQKYSEIAGILVRELNKLEEKMFVLLDYNLYVESDFYEQYYDFFLSPIKIRNKWNRHNDFFVILLKLYYIKNIYWKIIL